MVEFLMHFMVALDYIQEIGLVQVPVVRELTQAQYMTLILLPTQVIGDLDFQTVRVSCIWKTILEHGI